MSSDFSGKTAALKPAAIRTAVENWLGHIRALAEGIGPRGSATDDERRGAEYSADILRKLGIAPVTETFPSSGSVFRPHLAASLGMLFAFLLFPLARPWTAYAAAGLAALVTVSEICELALRDNPLRWVLPKRVSRNVHAVLAPAGEARRDVVLIGHLDTQRTPIIFSTQRWLDAYQILSTIAFVAFIYQTVLIGLGAFLRAGWIWPASWGALPFILLLLLLTLHAENTPYTKGANDNATAVGILLVLGEALKAAPLKRTRVWLVCTGSEEALHEGARHFFSTHKHELTDARAISFELLGCAGPSWLEREGIVTPLYPDPGLRKLAEKIARERPHLEAYPSRISGGVTEASDAINAGVPAITLIGMDRMNHAPYWHQEADTADKMRPEILAKAYEFAWTMLTELDAEAERVKG